MTNTDAANGPFAALHAKLARAASDAGTAGRISGTPGEAAALGQPFRGLPDGVKHVKQMLETLRAIGTALPFSRPALTTLEVLVDLCPGKPWSVGKDDHRPIVVVSNYELASRLGLGIRAVQTHLKELAAAGAIARRGDNSGHRTRRRMPDGKEYRYGIDLSPLVVFYEQMKDHFDRARAHRNAMKVAISSFRQVTSEAASLRDVAQMLASAALEMESQQGLVVDAAVRRATVTAIETGRAIEEAADLVFAAQSADTTLPEADRAANLDLVNRHVIAARGLLDTMRREVFEGLATLPAECWDQRMAGTISRGINALSVDKAKKDSPTDESGFTQTHTKGLNPSKEGYDSATLVVSPPRGVRPVSNQSELPLNDERAANSQAKPAIEPEKQAPYPSVSIAVEALLRMDEALPDILARVAGKTIDAATVKDILDVGRDLVVNEFGGSARIWGEQCANVGVVTAALAALIVRAKSDEELSRGSRIAYWLGIVRKPAAEINIVPSIFAAIRRRQTRVPAEV